MKYILQTETGSPSPDLTVLAPWQYAVIHNSVLLGWLRNEGEGWFGYAFTASYCPKDAVKTTKKNEYDSTTQLAVKRMIAMSPILDSSNEN